MDTNGAVTLPDPIACYFDAVNRDDWDSLSRLWTEESEVVAVGGRPRRGIADILDYYRNLVSRWPDHVDRPTRCLVAGSAVTVEITFEGTSDEGAYVTFDAVDVFDLAGETIRRVSIWYDIALVRSRMGRRIPAAVSEYAAAIASGDRGGVRGALAADATVQVGGGPAMVLGPDVESLWSGVPADAGYEIEDRRPQVVQFGEHGAGGVVDLLDVRDGRIARVSRWSDG